MARQKSATSFSGMLEVLAGGPLDSRQVVNLKADLIDPDSYEYFYEGLTVYVKEEKKSYTLKGDDPTLLENWELVGTGATGTGDSYDDTALKERVSLLEGAIGENSIEKSVPADAVFTDTVYDDTDILDRLQDAEEILADSYTKAEVDERIAEELGAFDHLDYKIADSAPTAEKVVIEGEEVETKEGVRYLVKHATENSFEEYILLDGVVRDIGSTSEVDLDGYVQTDDLADVAFSGDYNDLINIPEGVDASLSEAITVSNPTGNYKMDDVIAKGTSIEAVLKNLLSKVYYPTLTNPSASISYDAPALMKVGATIASKGATVGLNRGAISPQYEAESAQRSGSATGYKLTITGANTAFDESNETGTFTIPAITRTSKGNIVLTGTVNYAEGCQPTDSTGAPFNSPLPAGSTSATKTIEFILPFVRGVSASASVTSLNSMIEDLTKKANKTYSYTTNNEHLVFAYDASYGELKSILDQNGFENIDGFNRTTLTYDGQSYYVYMTASPTTDTNASYQFKF